MKRKAKEKKPRIYKKICVVPDVHLGYADWTALKKIHKYAKKHKPDLVVFLGDVIDAKAWSRFPKDPDDDSPQEEWNKVEADMAKLHSMFPKAILLIGNHDQRVINKQKEAMMPYQLTQSMDKIFSFKNWTWHTCVKPLIIQTPTGPIAFMHGDEMAGTPAQKAKKLGMSVIQGHTHQASLEYVTTFSHRIFGLESGHVADLSSKAMRYAVKNPISCTTAFTWVQDGVPYLTPL